LTTVIEPRTEAAPDVPASAGDDAPKTSADGITQDGTDSSAAKDTAEAAAETPADVPAAPKRGPMPWYMRIVAGVAVVAGTVVTGVGFALSYNALVASATGWGFGRWGARLFPIGVDGLVIALYAVSLVLAWLRMPKPMLVLFAHAGTAVTITLNVLAAADSAPGRPGVRDLLFTDPGRLLSHAVMPAAYVVLVEAARHLIVRSARLESGDGRGGELSLADWVLDGPTTWKVYRLATTRSMTYAQARGIRRELEIHKLWIQYREEIETARREAEAAGEEFDEDARVTVLDRLPMLLAPYGVTPQEALAMPGRMRAQEQQRRADRARADQLLAHKKKAEDRDRAHADRMADLTAKAEEVRKQGELDVLTAKVEGETQAAAHQAAALADEAGIEASARRSRAERAATEEQRRIEAQAQAEESARTAALRLKTAEDDAAALRLEGENGRRRRESAAAALETARAAAEAKRLAAEAAETENRAAALAQDAAHKRAAAAEFDLRATLAEEAAGLSERDRNIRRVVRLAHAEAGGQVLALTTTRIEQYCGVVNSTATGYREAAAALANSGYDPMTDPLHAADQYTAASR